MFAFIKAAVKPERAEEVQRELCGLCLSHYLAELTFATTGYPLAYAAGLRAAEWVHPVQPSLQCDCPLTR